MKPKSKSTKTKSIKALQTLDPRDPEVAHAEAEDVLLNYLRKTGDADLADAFVRARDSIGFWYA